MAGVAFCVYFALTVRRHEHQQPISDSGNFVIQQARITASLGAVPSFYFSFKSNNNPTYRHQQAKMKERLRSKLSISDVEHSRTIVGHEKEKVARINWDNDKDSRLIERF